MAKENNFDKLRSMVHQGLPMEKPTEKTVPTKEELKPTETTIDASTMAIEPSVADTTVVTDAVAEAKMDEQSEDISEVAVKVPEPTARSAEKRKRKPPMDYQSLFFNRVDLTHRKPLYITATTHRRLMRIVHLMDESKATIGSYVENIILHHLDTFKEDIDTIYQTNSINPTE